MAASYSLWLRPPPASPLGRLTARLIEESSSSLGTPRFVPHVTLLGGFHAGSHEEALASTRALARTLRALRCQPVCRGTHVEAGQLFYQCVYWRMELDEQLVRAHEEARQAFNAPASPCSVFMPHLSLVYGDVSEEAKAACVASATAEVANHLAEEERAFAPLSLSLWWTPSGETERWVQIEDVLVALELDTLSGGDDEV
jgi:2'-5' RNA ligase